MSVWLSDPSKGPVRRSTAASTTVAPFTITASLQFDPGAALHPRQPQRSLGLQALALGKRAPSFAHMCSRHPGRRIFSTSLAQSRPHDPPPGPSTSRLSLVNACDRTPAPARTAPPHSASGFAPSLSLNPPPLSPLLWGLSHSQFLVSRFYSCPNSCLPARFCRPTRSGPITGTSSAAAALPRSYQVRLVAPRAAVAIPVPARTAKLTRALDSERDSVLRQRPAFSRSISPDVLRRSVSIARASSNRGLSPHACV